MNLEPYFLKALGSDLSVRCSFNSKGKPLKKSYSTQALGILGSFEITKLPFSDVFEVQFKLLEVRYSVIVWFDLELFLKDRPTPC